MEMLPTLCTAMKRAGGDALMLRTGDSPHVLTANGRQNVARAILSANALEALLAQIFTADGRRTLLDTGNIVEEVTVREAGLTLTARAERTPDQVTIELRERTAVPAPEPASELTAPEPVMAAVAAFEPPVPAPTLEPAPGPVAIEVEAPPSADAGEAQQWFEVPLSSGAEGTFDAVPSFASTADVPETPAVAPVHELQAEPETLSGVEDVRYEELFLQVPPVVPPVDEPQPEVFPVSASSTPAPEAQNWTFDEPPAVVPPAFEHHPPVHEESAVSVSPDLRFVEPPPVSAALPEEGHPADLSSWAVRAMSRGATALYLRSDTAPLVRVEDRLEPLSATSVDSWRFEELLVEFNGGRAKGWEAGPHGELSWRVPSVGVVSCWSFNDDQGRGLMLRVRPQAPSRSLLKMVPRRVRAACDGDGLVVVSAPTSSDLAAVAAAVGDIAGRQRGGYVISLRPAGAPRHEIAGAFVSQREFTGSDGDVAAAIRAAASESPDVLLVAPPSSEAAMREAVNAAEGGRLVVLAVLASTSMQALRAIVGRSSAGGDAQTRLALATSFRVAFTYRMLQRLGGGRIAVRDLVAGTSEVSAMLASGDFTGIARLQREGSMSMTSVDDSLARAVRRGHLSLRQAASHAVDRKYLVALVRKGRRRLEPAGDTMPVSHSGVLEPVSSSRQRWSY
jgi:twitching motility protein PilT